MRRPDTAGVLIFLGMLMLPFLMWLYLAVVGLPELELHKSVPGSAWSKGNVPE